MTVKELIKRIQTFKEEYVSYFKPLEEADIDISETSETNVRYEKTSVTVEVF